MKFVLFSFPIVAIFCGEGLDYTHVDTGFQSIHVIEVDPARYEIRPVKALDDGIGRESVLSIQTRYGALASVNGGFFSIGGTWDGRAAGALKIRDWYALPTKPRGCVGWDERQSPKMDRLLARVSGSYQSIPFSVDGLNRVRRVGEMILFTPCFHRTTLTNPDGEEVLVVDGVIKTIARGGSSKIPENGCVLSIQEKHPLFHTFQEGTPLTFSTQITPLLGAQGEWDSCEYVVGGTPLLLHNGARILDFESEQTILTFLTWRHARTALGLLPNGHWLFVVVDKTGLFDGMTIGELADLMKKLGCVDALNLDGGGSATMVYEGTVKNTPHGDEDEGLGQSCRRVSDAIVILPKTKPFF